MNKSPAMLLAVLLVIAFIAIIFFILPISQAKYIDVPYFGQTDSGNCLQANLKMALKYYYPERDYSFEMLDNLTGRSKGKWTWTSQAMPFLAEQGLNACYYSTTPYAEILDGGETFILENYGKEDGNAMIQHTDFDYLYKSIRYLDSLDCYENRKLGFTEVEKDFFSGSIIILIVDESVLIDRNSTYLGHFVTITGINSTNVRFHDSGGISNRIEAKQKFIDAWNAKGTDNDAIVIKGVMG